MTEKVTLAEMLSAREERVRRQRRLLDHYGLPLVSFTMNIAGPVKDNALIRRGFRMGRDTLLEQLACAKAPVLRREEICEKTGCEGLYVVDLLPRTLKEITCEIEERSEIGRLLDLDVILPDGTKLERFSPRQCLICGKPVLECSRSRAHSVKELQAKTREILQNAVDRDDARTAAGLAVRALLYEVATTPKPGLVDRINNGSHRDMDIYTFMSSSSELWPYFERCVLVGRQTAAADPAVTGEALRWEGKKAEGRMLAATGGVNTHKGAIFSLGLICGALGRLDRTAWSEPETVTAQAAAMVAQRVDQELSKLEPSQAGTVGQKLYLRYGVTGVRGEVRDGFPSVLSHGLPVLEEGLSRGLGWDRSGSAALLSLAANTSDTNMIFRGGIERQQTEAEELRQLLERDPFPESETIMALDRTYIEGNLSPGGSADLLSVCYLLHFLKGVGNEPLCQSDLSR